MCEGGLTPESWDDPTSVRQVLDTIKAGGLVLLIGQFGTGKTQLGAWACYGCCLGPPPEWGKAAMYRRFSDLLSEMRDECYERGGSDARLVARLGRVRLVVIDELHHRRWTEDESLWLMRLLDHRYGSKMPTLLIANLTADAARDSLDGSIIDRMREEGAVVEMRGTSRRGVA